MSDEQRGERRNRVLKGATIILGVKESEIACVIRNQHAGGAELKVPVERQVPAEFLLYVPIDEIAYQCSLRWRRGERVGVRFLGTAPKPKLHYG